MPLYNGLYATKYILPYFCVKRGLRGVGNRRRPMIQKLELCKDVKRCGSNVKRNRMPLDGGGQDRV